MPQGYVKVTDLPQVIPVFPLDGALLLPRGQLPLNIFEPRYLNMVDDAMAGERVIGMIQTVGGQRARPDLANIGCIGRVTAYSETSDGRYLVTLTGVARFRVIAELPVQTPYRQVQVDYEPFHEDLKPSPEDFAFDREHFLEALKAYLARRALDVDWATAEAAPEEALVNSLSMALPFDPAEKQALLEADSLVDRRKALTALLQIDAADPSDGAPPAVQ
ncbi:LON peptidase substrate-binding domain-containing protein [Caulobacter sp. 17J80-11]|uniref:LON peptidase substrate-binding domain-containing protein n=1 Tax=Caulobacter sp. 17J80-11 TaxID=2763502 RepID=UPI001653A6FA|nr:LON peptidase substrate-binding domain-containing protein [Caulobacter sp. 17J80-11]MBC6983816.1 LON peptidase substrate-binding domain-containing protein [Caulobacter sp. 17J80-11]